VHGEQLDEFEPEYAPEAQAAQRFEGAPVTAR